MKTAHILGIILFTAGLSITGTITAIELYDDPTVINKTKTIEVTKVYNTTNTKIENHTTYMQEHNNISIDKHYANAPTYGFDDVGYIDSNTYKVQDVEQFCIFGNSMQPTLSAGNTVLMREYDNQDIERGMIIRFQDKDEENKYVIHRVRGVYPGYIRTKGDNNMYLDDPVTRNQITHIAVDIALTDKDCIEQYG